MPDSLHQTANGGEADWVAPTYICIYHVPACRVLKAENTKRSNFAP